LSILFDLEYSVENVIFTKPYKDATSGAISITSTVMINDTLTEAPIVIAIDFLITNFVTKILIDEQSPNPDTYTVLFHQDNNTVIKLAFLNSLTNIMSILFFNLFLGTASQILGELK